MAVEGALKEETESEMIAAQYQALQTKHHATKILQTVTDSKCRLCKQFDVTVEHILSSRPILAKEQYVTGHDRLCFQLHFNICKETGVKLENEHWYNHVTKSVEISH